MKIVTARLLKYLDDFNIVPVQVLTEEEKKFLGICPRSPETVSSITVADRYTWTVSAQSTVSAGTAASTNANTVDCGQYQMSRRHICIEGRIYNPRKDFTARLLEYYRATQGISVERKYLLATQGISDDVKFAEYSVTCDSLQLNDGLVINYNPVECKVTEYFFKVAPFDKLGLNLDILDKTTVLKILDEHFAAGDAFDSFDNQVCKMSNGASNNDLSLHFLPIYHIDEPRETWHSTTSHPLKNWFRKSSTQFWTNFGKK
jgi:hypothetical protein